MDDDLPEKFPDFCSYVRNSIPQLLWTAEAFERECGRRARDMGMQKTDLDLQIRVAMDCLGPQGLPLAEEVYRELRKVVRARVPAEKLKERLWDAVVAFGCGWERQIEDGATGWKDFWPGAIAVLEALVRRSMKSANFKLLRSVGLGGSEEFNLKKRGKAEAIPYHLAMQLVRPVNELDLGKDQSLSIVAKEGSIAVGQEVDVPAGGKHVIDVAGQGATIEIKGEKHILGFGVRLVIACCDGGAEIRIYPEKKIFRLNSGESARLFLQGEQTKLFVRECTCGTARCAERHRIAFWDPAKNSLRAFVAAAVKGLKPGGGNSLPGLVSLQQGMYFQHLNRGVEARLGAKKNRVDVRLRIVSAAAKQCICGVEFLEESCHACGAKFDPARMKIIKKKAFLILEGVGPENETRLEQMGKRFVRKGFLRCNGRNKEEGRVCDDHFELSDGLLGQQVKCHECGRPLFLQDEIRKLFTAGSSRLGILRKLQEKRRRLMQKKTECPHCGAQVHEITVECPLCGSCKLGQNLVFLYERRSPILLRTPREPGSADEGEGDNVDDPGPDDPTPEEV